MSSAIEERLGSPVVSAASHAGGFSPGLATRLDTAAGDRVFVKAVSSAINRVSSQLHRREARVAFALPRNAPAPRPRWSLDDGEWVVLAFDYLDGTNPPLPWREDDLGRVLDALHELSRLLTPSPVVLESAEELVGSTLMAWRDFYDDPADLARLPPAWQRRLDDLVELEGRWPALAAGETLAHLDIRADNIVLTPERVFFVDWPWAAIGAPWLDLVTMLPSVAMQGGADPETIWRRHPLSGGVDPDAVDAFLAGLAGMFTRHSMLPPQPGVPTVRAFQAGQGRTARAWLARRRGWADVSETGGR